MVHFGVKASVFRRPGSKENYCPLFRNGVDARTSSPAENN